MRRRFSLILIGILLFVNLYNPVYAATDYNFYYINDEKHFSIKRDVSYNGESLDLSAAPALAIDGYNYLPAEALASAITDLEASYNSDSGKLTLTYKETTLTMTKNKTSVKVNGSSKTISLAPVLLKFANSDKNLLYIPAQETVSLLGLDYNYDFANKLIKITKEEDEAIADDTFNPTITLARPSDVSKGSVSFKDDYHNKQFVITVDGNYQTFFKNNKPSLPSGVTYTVSYNSSAGETNIIFTTASINGWKVKEDNNYIYIMNGLPTDIYKNVIVLDPGHGGSDPGACYGTTYREADFTLGIVLAALKEFEGNDDYKVYSTRLSNTLPSGINKVWDRRTFANDLNADIFISVHINAYNSSSTGTETLYNSNHNVKNSGGLSCYELASIVQSYVLDATGFKDRGVKVDSSLSVLIKNNNPAVLTEIGFISNYNEAKTMAANLNNYGIALYNAIVNASTKYPTGR